MAIEVVRRRVCDVCGEHEGIRRVRISLLDDTTKTQTVDLCPRHIEPVLEAVKAREQGGLRKARTVTTKKQVQTKRQTRKRS